MIAWFQRTFGKLSIQARARIDLDETERHEYEALRRMEALEAELTMYAQRKANLLAILEGDKHGAHEQR